MEIWERHAPAFIPGRSTILAQLRKFPLCQFICRPFHGDGS
jgi:hypothetical protein